MKIKDMIKPNWTGALGTLAGWISGGVPGAVVGGALGTYMGNAEKSETKRQNQYNQAQAQLQNYYARQNWDLTNAYNDPSSQMERLKAAGLNPNLVYGGGNVTGNSASSLNANAVGDMNVFHSGDSLAKALPMMQGLANLRNTNTQNQLLNYQMGQTYAQTQAIEKQILMSDAQRAHLNLEDMALRHNLTLAQKMGLPVGQTSSIMGVKIPGDFHFSDAVPGFGLVNALYRKASDYLNKK